MPTLNTWYTSHSALDLVGIGDRLDAAGVKRYQQVCLRREEELVRAMLGLWVSELEPAVLRNRGGGMLGLTIAGIPVGARAPVVVRVEDVS